MEAQKFHELKKVRSVPGEIPEAPNLATFVGVQDTKSIAASSVSSISSVFNLVHETVPENCTSTTCKNSEQISTLPRPSNKNPVSYRPYSQPWQDFSSSPTTSTRAPETSCTEPSPAPCSSYQARSFTSQQRDHNVSRGEEICESYHRNKAQNRQIQQEHIAQREAAQSNFALQRRRERESWENWQAASTVTVLQHHERRQEEKASEEAKRRESFQEMISREIEKNQTEERASGENAWSQETSLDTPKILANPYEKTSGQQKSRKQNLIHRLVRPANYDIPALSYTPVSTVSVKDIQKIVPDVRARTANPETLYLLNGELIDLKCFEPSQVLPRRAIETYVSILEAKHTTNLKTQKLDVWPTTSVLTGTLETSEEFLAAVSNAEKNLIGLLNVNETTVAFLVNKSEKRIHVHDRSAPALQEYFAKVSMSIARRQQEPRWEVQFSEAPILPYTKTSDSAINALCAAEAWVTGLQQLPGVQSLNDFRQKAKWSIISEADAYALC